MQNLGERIERSSRLSNPQRISLPSDAIAFATA
jgi:hypothetical protein